MKDGTKLIDLLEKVGEEVIIYGWVQTVRSHGKIAFLDVRDGRTVVQVGGFGEELASKIASFHVQDVIKIIGLVKKRDEKYINPHLETGTIEVEAKDIELIQKSHEMPFDMAGKDLHLELPTLLDYRSLTLRHPAISYIFKVQAAIAEGFRKVAEELGCTEVFVPTIAASSTEGGAEVFRVNYYGFPAYMTQSPQLYKQMMVPVFGRVFTIAHAYRAEPSVTTRHLSEIVQIDCEFGFTTFEELLDLVEKVGREMLLHAENICEKELAEHAIPKILIGNIPRLTLREAQKIITERTGRDLSHEQDLNPEDEKEICVWAKETHKSDFVTVTHFPTKKKPFYTHPDPKNPEYSLSYDLLFRGTEILSGSQRVNDYETLIGAIKERGMNPDDFAMYLQAFKYGMPEEGGLSFGLERLTMKLLELPNIREASLFPRDMERVDERLSVLEEDKGKK